jgi:hypothetical protein
MIGLGGLIFYIIDSFPHKFSGKVSQYVDIILPVEYQKSKCVIAGFRYNYFYVDTE